MGLRVRVETRTGDTSAAKRQRQRRNPPDILLTTPEQLALLLASPDAEHLFASWPASRGMIAQRSDPRPRGSRGGGKKRSII